jgi:protein-disulfide isomerase
MRPHLRHKRQPSQAAAALCPVRTAAIAMAVLACMILAIAPARAADPGITSSQADEILTELRKIRQLLENGAAGAQASATTLAAPVSDRVSVTIRDSNALGRDDAPLTLIEFADFQCPFCRRFHTLTFDQIKRNFVDTGIVRYVSRDLPLPMHDRAPQAATAARCAGDQRRFWELRHLLMVNQSKLKRADLIAYARQINLNLPAFTACIDSDRHDAEVQQDAADAAEVGVDGTPTFIIGHTLQQGRFEGVKIEGAQPYSVFETKIRELLSEPGAVAKQ